MASQSTPETAQTRLYLLVAILFVTYLCIAIPLPVVPLYVTRQIGLNNVWAGLAVGIAFLSTIATRGYAGALSDRRGAKVSVMRGLLCYAAGAVVSLSAGLLLHAPIAAFLVLLAGRLLLGFGESLGGVGLIAWGISLVGPARSGKVLALVGAAIYGALAIGAPIGLAVFGSFGFIGTMAISALLPCMGLLAIWFVPGVAAHPDINRPPFSTVLRQIWWHGLVICLQGIGFATIGAFFVLYFLHQNWNYAGFGFTAFGGGFVLVRVLFGHLPDRLGGLPVAIGSLAVEAIGLFLIWGANDPTIALVGAFFTGLGCSMVFPAMGREVVYLVEPQLRATALGGFTAFQDLAYGLTGPLAGLLADRMGYSSVFLIGCVAATLGLVIAVLLRWRQQAQSH